MNIRVSFKDRSRRPPAYFDHRASPHYDVLYGLDHGVEWLASITAATPVPCLPARPGSENGGTATN